MSIYEFREFVREKFPYPKIRPQQIKMMEKIFDCITKRKNLVVEAPTGVGKTLSYLIPALYFAEKGKRVMILTETIDQQERILDDLNSLKHNLKVSFMMGKGNFFCKSKNGKANRLYCQLNKKCKYRPNKKPICYCGTKKIALELDGGVKYYCPFCTCDYQRAKIESIFADIVVMNNSIYYYAKEDIDKKRETDIIICDEAHKLEGSIRNAATISINPDVALNRLKFMVYHYAPYRLIRHLERADEGKFWEVVEDYVERHADIKECKNSLIFDNTLGKITSWRYKEDVAILGTLLDGYYQIKKIKERIDALEENIELDRGDLKFKVDNNALIPLELQFVNEKRISEMHLMEFLDNLENLKSINENFVVYKNNSSILCEPIVVSSYLRRLYGDAAVIHCSATLGNLKIHALKTGVRNAEILMLTSPFPKDRRKIIALKDGEDMKWEENSSKRKKANENLLRIIEACNGNTLVLFKSFEDLSSAYEYLLNNIDQININNKNIYCYGKNMDGKEAKKLKERFEENGGILLATGRFAEGVDIPGEALTSVIIDSLPFPVPTPLIKKEQKMIEEQFKKRGVKDARWKGFLMTSFHIMARTVIQMIGRLIRTETDYGVVVIQDRRFGNWVGRVMKERGYLKDNYELMTLNEAISFIPKFMGKYRKSF